MSYETEARKVLKRLRSLSDDYDLELSIAESKWLLKNQDANEYQKRFFRQGMSFRWEVKFNILKQKFGEELIELFTNHSRNYFEEKAENLKWKSGIKDFERFIRNRERRLVRRVATLIKQKKVKPPK